MSSIQITDFSVFSNTIKFILAEDLPLLNSNLFIYIDDILLAPSQFILSKDSQDNYYVVNLLAQTNYDKISFYVSQNNLESNICTNYHNLKMINYDNFSFNELNFKFPSAIDSSNYKLYGFKFNNYEISSNFILLPLCNGINSNSSYIKQIPDTTTDNSIFEIILFDENGQIVPDSNYILEVHS